LRLLGVNLQGAEPISQVLHSEEGPWPHSQTLD